MSRIIDTARRGLRFSGAAGGTSLTLGSTVSVGLGIQPLGPTGATFDVLLNANFGTAKPNATITTRAQLFGAPGAIAYPFYEYGINPGQSPGFPAHSGGFGSETYYGPQGAGVDGLYGNYVGRHVAFPEGSAHNLHVLKSDRLTLRAFAGLDGNPANVSAPNIVGGMLRYLVPMRPGDYAEIRCIMPKGRYAWPAFWTNPGESAGWTDVNTPGKLISASWPPENDIFDQFGFNSTDPGHYLIAATPDNGHPDRYNIGDVNMPGQSSPFVDTALTTWGGNFYASTTFDQTAGFHVYGCLMGLDGKNYYYVDGVLYRIRSQIWPDTSPPAQLITSLQVGAYFNDLSGMTDQGGVTNGWDWDIDYVRIFRTRVTPPVYPAQNPNGVTFASVVDFVATGGSSSNGQINQGWADPNSSWSQRSDNMFTSGCYGNSPWWSTNQLTRTATSEKRINSRTRQRFINFINAQFWATLRVTGPNATPTCIMVGPGKTSSVVNGTRVDDQGTAYYNATYTWLDLEATAIQISPTVTVVTAKVFAASDQATPALCAGTLLHQVSFNVTTSAVQNLSGNQGMFFSYLYSGDNAAANPGNPSVFNDGMVVAQWKSLGDVTEAGSGTGSGGGTSGGTVTEAPLSTAIYVSASGSDSNNGTNASIPVQTFAKAQQLANAMNTAGVYVRGNGGTYNLSQALTFGRADVGRKWLAYPGDARPDINAGGLSAPICLLYGTKNLTFRGMKVRNWVGSGIELHGGGSVDDRVDGNKIIDNEVCDGTITSLTLGAGTTGGIHGQFWASNNEIAYNYVHDVDSAGISFVEGGSGENISGNNIHHNLVVTTNRTGQADTGGIYLLGRSHASVGTIIAYNIVKDFSIAAGAHPGNDTKGIYLDDELGSATVTQNIVCGKGTWGFQIHGGDHTEWHGNIIDLTQMMELCLYQSDAEFGNFGMGQNNVSGNIFYSRAPFVGNTGEFGQPGLWTTLLNGGDVGPNCNNNVYWSTTGTQLPNQNDVVDPNAHFVDPHFTNASANDYSMTDGGSAVSTALGLTFAPIDQTQVGPRTYALGTAVVTFTGVTTASSVNGNISATVALTYIGQVYMALSVGGVQEGSRVATTGGSVTLHPTATGDHVLEAWDSSTGGNKLQNSSAITVTGPVAGATLSNVSSQITAGGSIFANVALVNITTAYGQLENSSNGAIGSRVAFSGNIFPSITVASPGSNKISVWDQITGGTALDRSGLVTINAAGAVPSPAIFVSPSGSDSNAGTSSGLPKLTPQAAILAARAAGYHYVLYRAGTYNVTHRIETTALDNGIVQQPYPGETAIIDGGNSTIDGFWADYHSANQTWRGLTIRNFTQSGIHLNGYETPGDDGTITGCVIENCEIYNIFNDGQYGAGNNAGIRGSFATAGNIVRHNYIHDIQGPGVAFVAGVSQDGTKNEWTYSNQIIYNKIINTNSQNQSDTGAIYIINRGHVSDPNNPSVIAYNIVDGTGSGGDTKFIYMDDEASYVNIYGNICRGVAQYGFQIHGGDNIKIYNNIFDLTNCDHFLGFYQDISGLSQSQMPNYGMAGNEFHGNIVITRGIYFQNQLWQYLNQSSDPNSIAKPNVYNNLYFSTGTALPLSGAVVDTSPQVHDPMFTNAAAGDYSFLSSAGYSLIGFTPINQSLIGPQ